MSSRDELILSVVSESVEGLVGYGVPRHL
jgi:hypothetical protein